MDLKDRRGEGTAVHYWDGLAEVPPGLEPSVVTIGNFDGVHRGHRQVLEHVVSTARSAGRCAIAITFDPHPLHVLRPDQAPPVITGLEEPAATGDTE